MSIFFPIFFPPAQKTHPPFLVPLQCWRVPPRDILHVSLPTRDVARYLKGLIAPNNCPPQGVWIPSHHQDDNTFFVGNLYLGFEDDLEDDFSFSIGLILGDLW